MSFAVQAMSAKYLADHRAELHPGVIRVPHEIDDAIARKKLSTLGITIDTLTDEQKKVSRRLNYKTKTAPCGNAGRCLLSL